ncbi:hypothetical protein RE6C_04543 [Rhodopirellula europaea 6C]|uniref:Uncharacterized protein n=1 Tax=Rhodopirellula europaea 6C TaxID=1263867 RepID=M2A4P0_9BACT|nr:hypothetical protein RE6C_04543 [Rhodopirellula europaea 6C]
MLNETSCLVRRFVASNDSTSKSRHAFSVIQSPSQIAERHASYLHRRMGFLSGDGSDRLG